jgi:hypothetical protein
MPESHGLDLRLQQQLKHSSEAVMFAPGPEETLAKAAGGAPLAG